MFIHTPCCTHTFISGNKHDFSLLKQKRCYHLMPCPKAVWHPVNFSGIFKAIVLFHCRVMSVCRLLELFFIWLRCAEWKTYYSVISHRKTTNCIEGHGICFSWSQDIRSETSLRLQLQGLICFWKMVLVFLALFWWCVGIFAMHFPDIDLKQTWQALWLLICLSWHSLIITFSLVQIIQFLLFAQNNSTVPSIFNYYIDLEICIRC